MKIERPDWQTSWDDSRLHWEKFLNKWFDENVTPINALLADGVMVTGYKEGDYYYMGNDPNESQPKDSHKAILIGITPIKKESAEDVLRDLTRNWASFSGKSNDLGRLIDRAMAVLGDDDAE